MAHDGMRGQTYTRKRATPGAARSAPSDIIAQATITDGGFVIHLRHTGLGLLGRIMVSALGDNHLFIEGHVAGHPDDPTTKQRQAVLQPIIATLERALSSAGSDLAHARALVEGLLTPGRVAHDVPRQIATRICPCTHCGGPIAVGTWVATLDSQGELVDHDPEQDRPFYSARSQMFDPGFPHPAAAAAPLSQPRQRGVHLSLCRGWERGRG